MDDYKVFRDLATHPYSLRSLRMLGSALAIIKNRYSQFSTSDLDTDLWEFPSREHFTESKDTDIPVNRRWTDYMKIIADSNPDHGDESQSMWRLAGNDHLDVIVVTKYIKLLQLSSPSSPSPPSHRTQQPIIVGTGANTIVIDPEVKMTLLPIQYENSWFAAVAYADCIHVYNSDNEGAMPPEMQKWLSSTFPTRQIRCCALTEASEQKDSGLFMLLAMRMLVSGRAPTRRNDREFVRYLRAKTFIELLTGNLNASDQDVETLHEAFDKDTSCYFDDAFVSHHSSPCGPDSSSTADTGTVAQMPPESVRSTEDQPVPFDMCVTSWGTSTGSGSYSRRLPSQVVSSRSNANAQDNATEITVPNSRNTEGRSRNRSATPPSMPQECKNILQLLSEAVVFHRSSRLTGSSDLATLWSFIRNDFSNGFKSEFYRRYNGVLFYEKMLGLHSDREIATLLELPLGNARDLQEVKKLQSRFKVWHEICQLRNSWGKGRYTLLCAVSDGSSLERASSEQKESKLSRLKSRLEDEEDPLSGWINSARELCCSLIEDRFPRDRLMIDNYHLKASWTLYEPEFAAYTSMNPNATIEIERMAA
ncbi:hypothetical protein CSUB01_08507 [Colletotrichum sublineola]|uniref:Uncharacterized protein n=1 Tax=Colletotrichum sublineola TaxID=1173701 RepID=A0A066XAF5_COLSU|nr:hypothetical protein CSUB01_08507 [Colletotrichum sublineola]